MNRAVFTPSVMAMVLQGMSYAARDRFQARVHAELDEKISARGLLAARIVECQERGRLYLIESGRDCDGVQYSGRVHEIDATVFAYWAKYNDIGEWADGPFRLTIVTWKEANEARYVSRDLVMEAFEDGHPHVIYSSL